METNYLIFYEARKLLLFDHTLSDSETQWIMTVTASQSFTYLSTPPHRIKNILEKVFGPLDYEIPYV